MDIAEKVDILFKTIKKPDGKGYSYREVARRANDAVSSTTVWKVRTGQIENPSQKVIQALAEAFGVHASYFFDESITPDEVPKYRARYRDEKLVERIALRASGLDANGKQAILDMINYVRRAQGLDSQGGLDGEEAGGQSPDAGASG